MHRHDGTNVHADVSECFALSFHHTTLLVAYIKHLLPVNILTLCIKKNIATVHRTSLDSSVHALLFGCM